MNQTIAIYARKSVERIDSISIESQIEFCKFEAKGEDCNIYSDNGYSGKNTQRPAFHQMMEDIRKGKVRAVIVYKLDRISRSILDFSEMMQEFQNYGVQFISATEKFDTSSPMGRAMLNICIVFAQLERETIQQRVTDAYYSRCKKGFYMGGRVPYGFTLDDTIVDGVRTSMYKQIRDEIADIKMMYNLYAMPHTTLGDVLREVQKVPEGNRRERCWSTHRISELLRNPIYCRADHTVYQFFKSQNANIYNSPDDFIGVNGLYLFKGTTNKNDKKVDLSGREIVIAPHEGIIDPRTWLICRKKLLGNKKSASIGKAKNSWLVGLVKCGSCDHSMVVRKSARKDSVVRYFCCYMKAETHRCNGVGRTVHALQFEDEIKHEIEKKISELSITAPTNDSNISKQIDLHKIEIERIEESIQALVSKIPDATTTVMQYINDKVSELDKQKLEIEQIISDLQSNTETSQIAKLDNCMRVWDEMSIDDKTGVARLLIDKISIYPDHAHICWKI